MKKDFNQYIIGGVLLGVFLVTMITLNVILSKNMNVNEGSINEEEVFEEGQSTYDSNNSKFVQDGEMRGVWLSTVSNLDWPEVGSYNDKNMQKEMLKEKFDFIEEENMNTIFFQVRPMGDALYNSSYAPWSKYLTGTLGQSPGYDPLTVAVDEAHKRNLELQAWFNPFRIDSNAEKFNINDYIDTLAEGAELKKHPEWIVKYGNYHYLDLGIPAVREYVIDLILEVVENYNIDGVHIDDYFYPYPIDGVEFPDDNTYATYGGGFSSKADWRRNNIDSFISELNSRIKEVKPQVKFGVSPFGIWRNGESLGGSATRGLSSYEDLYVDSKKWIEEGWIDYIAPQIYWEFNHSTASYKTLVEWWAKQVEGTNVQLYIGHALYKINDSQYGDAWLDASEVINQVNYAKENENVSGSCFFRYKSLEENRLGFADKIKEFYNRN